MKVDWSAGHVPRLDGRTAIVTGASGGVGYEIARQLAARGAHVVLASRDEARTSQAAYSIRAACAEASVEAMRLDLADFGSIGAFASAFAERHGRLDILVNNAGISGGPRRETRDGFEMLFQVNYLGHFALTGLLLALLNRRPGSRVVTLSSDIAAAGQIDFDDLLGTRRYGLVRTYAQSKLAGLIFAIELERRARSVGAGLSSFATNPGIARTDLFAAKSADWGRSITLQERLLRTVQMLLGRPAAVGALPPLYQATDPMARASNYVVGTRWPKKPHPTVDAFPARACDPAVADRLWEISVEFTGVDYAALAGASFRRVAASRA
jgi:NAD(P)-dependent dehydrogenase (short-subunit alcohol dehydrogenase family)